MTILSSWLSWEYVVGTGKVARGDHVVLGADIGGTSTRVVVADRDGEVLARGVAGGGNPVSAPDSAGAAFGQALRAALGGVDPGRVRAAVIGIAGGSALRDPQMRATFDRAWTGAGLTCTPDYRSDLEVAFAAGTAQSDGSVLIAGTGAVAGVISGHRLGHTVDGHGWLVGDDGSGFWLGREAVRATLRSLEQAGEEPGVLVRSVLQQLDVHGEAAGEGEGQAAQASVIHAVHSRPPVRLADLAPLVSVAHDQGDPAAVRIVDEAARRLADTLGRLPATYPTGPIVLAGSLTRPESPVGVTLRGLLAAGQPQTEPVTARDEVIGAVWLALLAAGPVVATARVRARLVADGVTTS